MLTYHHLEPKQGAMLHFCITSPLSCPIKAHDGLVLSLLLSCLMACDIDAWIQASSLLLASVLLAFGSCPFLCAIALFLPVDFLQAQKVMISLPYPLTLWPTLTEHGPWMSEFLTL